MTILCRGELGAGKTTLLCGLAAGLGIREVVASPTFAIAQRFRSLAGLSFTHLDLYRLSGADAAEQVAATEDHGGVRCIEWSERLAPDVVAEPVICVALAEDGSGRSLSIDFKDVPFPSTEAIQQWRHDVRLPQNVIGHSDAVAAVAVGLAERMIARGVVARPALLHRAGMVHDLFRFIDFRDGAGPPDAVVTAEDRAMWEPWKKRWHGVRHEEACARFLEEQGYGELGRIVAVHGLTLPSPERTTTEQKLLFYADKRVVGTTVVSLDERFEDFRRRYSAGRESEQSKAWYEEAKRVEAELGLG